MSQINVTYNMGSKIPATSNVSVAKKLRGTRGLPKNHFVILLGKSHGKKRMDTAVLFLNFPNRATNAIIHGITRF